MKLNGMTREVTFHILKKKIHQLNARSIYDRMQAQQPHQQQQQKQIVEKKIEKKEC